MQDKSANVRDLAPKDKLRLRDYALRWEMILLYLLMGIYIIGIIIKPDLFLRSDVVTSTIQSGMDKAILALGMYTLLGQGDRDMSAGGLVLLVAVVIGLLYGIGVPAVLCILGGVAVAVLCEVISSFLVAYMNFNAIIVGISMGTLYRGIAKIVLNDTSLNTYPEWFVDLSWDNVAGGWLPLSFITFIILSLVFYYLIHKTRFGRQMELIGTNKEAALYSGLNVRKLRMGGYMVFAVMSAIAAIFFVGRLGNGVNSSAGTGYEFQVLVIAILGTVEIKNRRPTVFGIMVSGLLISCLNYVLGLLGAQPMEKNLAIGIILILAVSTSRLFGAKLPGPLGRKRNTFS